MCFDLDSRPPVAPIAGGALDSRRTDSPAADGNVPRVPGACRRADRRRDDRAPRRPRPAPLLRGAGAAVRGAGIDAIAIDYFGRTAAAASAVTSSSTCPTSTRRPGTGSRRDITAAAEHLRGDGRVAVALHRGVLLRRPAGVPVANARPGTRRRHRLLRLADRAARGTAAPRRPTSPAQIAVRILGIFGGADQGINAEHGRGVPKALDAADVEHELVTYPGAPHSFFDRKAEQFAEASADAWDKVLAFMRRAHRRPSVLSLR